MRNKETGEFELVVGNGFLVSGFFIVILLFAVGVAMGYILGKNSEKTAQAQQGSAATSPAETRPQSSPTPTPSPTPAAATADPTQPTPAAEKASSAAPPAEKEPAPVTQPAKQDVARATPVPTPSPKSAPPAKKTAPQTDEAPSGFYWQVSATANQEAAHATQDTLSKKGFTVYMTPGPNNLTRVLVGPYGDTASRAKAKTDLEKLLGITPVAHPKP